MINWKYEDGVTDLWHGHKVHLRFPTKWDERFLQMAKLVASWSKDPSTQVGAVIVDSHNRIVSVGFNGYSSGANDDLSNTCRDDRLCRTIHAEVNAVLFATRRDMGDCTLYVTHPICISCLHVVNQVKIRKIVCLSGGKQFDSRWNVDSVVAEARCLGIDLTIQEGICE